MADNRFFPRLFSPGRIGSVDLRNRVVMLPMGTAYAAISGEVTSRTIDHYAERAKGGVGLVIVGNVSIEGRILPNQLVLDADWFLAGHYELVEAVHAWGARIAVQLNHPGRQKSGVTLEGQQPVSSSALGTVHLGERYPVARALEKEEIYALAGKFAAAAARARKVGYDIVEIHGSHGYLISQFLSPFMNKRTDEFGGSLENRLRFPLEVMRRVKQAVGDGFPVGMRINADDFIEGGVNLEESPAMAKALAGAGLAYLSVTDGIYESVTRCRDGMRREEGSKAYLWEAVKKAVDVPVLAGGGLHTPAYCEAVLGQGQADLIGLARPLLADPHWPDKARYGKVEDICPCIACFECTAPSPAGRQGARRCTVNAAVAREREFSDIRPAEVRKKVMIAGGGPGGMEAARVAALRGHRVTLYEKGQQLGGALLLAAAAPGKSRILSFRDYLEGQLRKLEVEVVLNTEVTAGTVERFKPDVVVLATGSEPVMPGIPGLDRANVAGALDVLGGKVKVSGEGVVVIGASGTGCETAEHLAARGNKVTVVKMRPGPAIAAGMQPFNRAVLLEHLEAAGVSILLDREVVEVTDAGVVVRDRKGGGSQLLPADRVVIAVGARPSRKLHESLQAAGVELYSIGDCQRPSIIKEAVYEGSLVGRRI